MWALYSIRQTVYDKFQTVIKAAQILQEISFAAVTNCHRCCSFKGQLLKLLEFWRSEFPKAKIEGWQGFLEAQGEAQGQASCLFQIWEATKSLDFQLRLFLKGSNGHYTFFLLLPSGPDHLFSLPHSQMTVSAITSGPTQISQSIFSAS